MSALKTLACLSAFSFMMLGLGAFLAVMGD